MIRWLVRRLARRELEELERWRVYCDEAERWFAEFPEVALALEHLRKQADGEQVDFINRVREKMRRLRAAALLRAAGQAQHS